MSLRKRVLGEMDAPATTATVAAGIDTSAPASAPVTSDGMARDAATEQRPLASGPAPVSRDKETVEIAPKPADLAGIQPKMLQRRAKTAEKPPVSDEKPTKIAPSRVPPSTTPLAEPGMGSGSMQLRTLANVDLEKIQLVREAQDAYEALKDRLSHLNPVDQRELKRLLVVELNEDGDDFDHEFDLKEEINSQMRLLRSMRSRAERENTSVRELKDILGSATTLIQLLIKEQEKVMNIDRLRTIEAAVVEAVQTLPQEQQDQFMQYLEGRLDGYGRSERGVV